MGYGIYTSCNGPPLSSTTQVLKSILRYVSDIILGETPWLNATTVCTFPAPWVTEDEADDNSMSHDPLPDDDPPRPLESYTGTFTNPGFGDIIISRHPSNQLEMHMGQLLHAFLHYNSSETTFYTNLTDKYWYLNDRIPLQFTSYMSSYGFDTLNIPLYSPFDKVEPTPFFKRNGDEKYETLRKKFNVFCTINCSQINYISPGIVILVTILVLCVTRFN